MAISISCYSLPSHLLSFSIFYCSFLFHFNNSLFSNLVSWVQFASMCLICWIWWNCLISVSMTQTPLNCSFCWRNSWTWIHLLLAPAGQVGPCLDYLCRRGCRDCVENCFLVWILFLRVVLAIRRWIGRILGYFHLVGRCFRDA